MFTTDTPPQTISKTTCYHCGETCDQSISADDKHFCCEGCKQVFLLLNENNLCAYYDLDKHPGIQAKGKFTSGRFDYLDDESVIQKLTRFTDGQQTHVAFSLPQMHCASCIWLLENLHRINPGILSSQANFQRKEVFIRFNPEKISLKKVVELLAFVGYEPYISLQDDSRKKLVSPNRKYVYRIGVAGFCFGNIMMLSFPEYFSSGNISETTLKEVFSYLNLALALPVIFYSASEFFVSAWKGLRQRWLNIDAPIALAILVAFGRSVYEILSGTGAGYLDSMSGIVFFMLIGRWFQNMTYDAFSFDRDYKSYFPLGVTVVRPEGEQQIPVSKLVKGDMIRVRNEEMIPADSVLRGGEAHIDYSFVSGEHTPVDKRRGELIYAGGKQCGGAIELEVVTPASQSYITQLWNNEIFHSEKNAEKSFIHPWSRYFTYALFTIAALAAAYWSRTDPAKVWPVVTAVLIVACPCSLLLSATFTYGNMVRVFGRNRMYLKNASVIESLAKADLVIFDKTGTLTHHHDADISFDGAPLDTREKAMIRAVASQSAHPLSRMIAASFGNEGDTGPDALDYREIPGQGAEARVSSSLVRLGSATFVVDPATIEGMTGDAGTRVYVSIDQQLRGSFCLQNAYRPGIREMASQLGEDGYQLHVLSGDHDQERSNLTGIFGSGTPMVFRQKPQEKLEYVRARQQEGHRVIMMGDGLNDAGALRQAQVGIAVSDQTNLFTPASDAILDGAATRHFAALMHFARSGKTIVTLSFILSILYNIVGLAFATQAKLSPLVAAILMPASSISIVVFVTLASSFSARRKGLEA
jgi:Cu+-exporting ATPase